ncbi:hypothetical protein BV25DRAFT_1421424 [Artomyces pyxidatus]|uniref:Uncharacterized protein n=1 Tax=Artomyces pyxidatus TaxID=48021 RepID=A0ACB8TE60_9AGAM|nr:hypothetical protein BV25DRAFT_1421424 [Artomyces pyxidatus]
MNGSVGTTLGAILLGGQLSFALSGAVAVQTFLYFRMYPKDALRIKATVVLVWVLDSIHTALMSAASWDYLIVHFGDVEAADYIPTTIALTVAFTAAITLVAHLFFTYRVFRLSKSNWCITAPLVVLTFCRLLAAMVSTVEMVHLRSFHAFTEDCGYLFTLGLSISSALDILIVCALCYFLQHSRTGFGSIDHVIDTIMIYTLNNGALTCLTTIVSMICWLTMPRNFIFLGLHFGISKRTCPAARRGLRF